MTDRILSHKLERNAITTYLLIHCVDDKDTKKEIKMREQNTVEEIQKTIKRMENINADIEKINVVRSYKEAVTNNGRRFDRTTVNRNVKPEQRYPSRTIECWTCREEGHLSRNCVKRRPIICHGCGKEGHIRRNRTTFRCRRCLLNGNIEDGCYTNLERRRFETRIPERYGRQMPHDGYRQDYDRRQKEDQERYRHRDNSFENRQHSENRGRIFGNGEQFDRRRRQDGTVAAIGDRTDDRRREFYGGRAGSLKSDASNENIEIYDEYPKEDAPSAGTMMGAIC